MRKILHVLMLFLCNQILIAQIAVGYNHTPNGNPIIGDYHSYLGSEYGGVQLSLENEFETYEKGSYLLKGKVIPVNTYIDFSASKLKVKLNYDTFSTKKILAENIEYLKLGVDSFFVLKNFRNKDKLIEDPVLVQYVASVGGQDYALFYEYYKMSGNLKDKFFISKGEHSTNWRRVVLKGELKEKLRKLFFVTDKYINKKELSINQFLNLIKEKQYKERLVSKKTIYFNQSWDEISNQKKAAFNANVLSKKDSIYNVLFSNLKKEKLFEVPTSSFTPSKKTGVMQVFSKGQVFQKRVYSNDSLKKVSYLTGDGKIKLEYENIVKIDPYYKNIIEKKYTKILKEGEEYNISKSIEDIKLKHGNDIVNYSISNGEMTDAFYVNEKGVKIFFFTKKKEKVIKVNKFGAELKSFLEIKKSFKKARINENLEGVVLLDIQTDYKGKLISYNKLNNLGNNMDTLIEQFCKNKLIEKFRFKGIKLEDKSDLCRFLLPITITHKRLFKTFSRPNNNYHQLFFQQQFLRQQQLQAPKLPSGF